MFAAVPGERPTEARQAVLGASFGVPQTDGRDSTQAASLAGLARLLAETEEGLVFAAVSDESAEPALAARLAVMDVLFGAPSAGGPNPDFPAVTVTGRASVVDVLEEGLAAELARLDKEEAVRQDRS